MDNRIAELRKARGLSMEALAGLVGTTAPQINKLEKGQRRLTADWMQRLGAALGCKPADLLAEPQGDGEAPSYTQPSFDPRPLLKCTAAAVREMLKKEGVTTTPEQFDDIVAEIFHAIITAPLKSDDERLAVLAFEINRRQEDLRKSHLGEPRKRPA